MKLFIKNKIFSLGGGSEVLDATGKPAFVVKGKVFSFTKKKKIFDANNKLLFTIKNRFFNFFSHKVYIYDADGERVATIKKNKWSFNLNYKIEDTPEQMEIVGKFFDPESKIVRNGEVVGTITRQITFIADSFQLEASEEDIAFMTALVIGLDNLVDEKRRDD